MNPNHLSKKPSALTVEENAKTNLATTPEVQANTQTPVSSETQLVGEVGGRKGLEPTRYGDWEQKGRCIDF